MFPLTVVIITKNEAANIIDCIRSARQITDNIVVVDSGSTDDTLSLLAKEDVTLVQVEWKCFGASRNTGARAARYEWIFSLDADERINADAVASLSAWQPLHDHEVFRIRRRNYLGGQPFYFGTAGFDRPVRLYNRNHARWDLSPVHEELQHKSKKVKLLKGRLMHYSMKSVDHYRIKLEHYASLCALKYHQKQKKAGIAKRYLSPWFNSFKSFFLQLGLLDGKKGFQLAKLILHYSFLKYKYLHQLRQNPNRQIEIIVSLKASA